MLKTIVTVISVIAIALLMSGCLTRLQPQELQKSPTQNITLPTAIKEKTEIEKILETQHDLNLGAGLVYKKNNQINHFDPKTTKTTEIIDLKDNNIRNPITVINKKFYAYIYTGDFYKGEYEIIEIDLRTGKRKIIQIPQIIKEYFNLVEVFSDGVMLWKQTNAHKIHVFDIISRQGKTYPLSDDVAFNEDSHVDTYDPTTQTVGIISGFLEFGSGSAQRFSFNLKTGKIANLRNHKSGILCLNGGFESLEHFAQADCTTEQIAESQAWADFIHQDEWDTRKNCAGFTIEHISPDPEPNKKPLRGIKMTSESTTHMIEDANEYQYWCIE